MDNVQKRKYLENKNKLLQCKALQGKKNVLKYINKTE